MKKLIGVLILVLIATSAFAAGSTEYMKYSNFSNFMKTATENLEKLFMGEMLTFSGDARQQFVSTWKTCQDNKSYPNISGPLGYLSITGTRDRLRKAAETLDTLVYDQLVQFKSPAAKQLYRDALKGIRGALDSL